MGRIWSRVSDESGIGVISAVIVGLVVFASGGTWISLAMHQGSSSANERDRERSFGAAEAAVHEAMSQMSFNPTLCPSKEQAEITTSNGVNYRWWIDQSQFSCAQVDQSVRYIVAQGWVGPQANPTARRQVEQQIKLKPLDGFKYAMFASPGGIEASQKMDIRGDVYSELDFTLANNSNIYNGGIVGQRAVTVTGSSIIGKDIWSVGNVALNHSGTNVQGDVKSSGEGATYGGNISNTGKIDKKAIAPGNITGTGTFSGGKVKANVVPPPKQTMPAFDASKVTFTHNHANAAAFNTFFNSSSTFTGVHRVTNNPTNFASLSSNFTVNQPLTMVVADGPIELTRNISASDSTTKFTLALITTSPADVAIRLSQNQTFPSNVSLLLFAPNGCVNFQNLKTFSGAVYARCITSNNQLNLTHLHPADIPGVDWTTSSATRFEIEAHVFREVVFQP